MFRKIFAVLIVVQVLAVLVGCGGSGLSGTYIYVGYVDDDFLEHNVTVYEFSGRSYTMLYYSSYADVYSGSVNIYDYTEEKGKYSISDGNIEFVDDKGRIEVFDFSRTDNTIEIEGTRFGKTDEKISEIIKEIDQYRDAPPAQDAPPPAAPPAADAPPSE